MNAGDDVLAVIVSFNGCENVRRLVEALREQVANRYIVDNGSDADTLAVLEELEREGLAGVTRLGRNAGVGHALNLGALRARELGCRWLLTMDQDSVPDAGMMQAYRMAIARDPGLVCLAPAVMEPGRRQVGDSGPVAYAITSGNLVRLDVLERVGPYDEGFFIDCIDFDFCLRLRATGRAVYRVADATMRHRLGEVRPVPRGVRRFYALHSPARRYYMSRNYLYLARRHFLRFPWFVLKLGLLQLLLTVLIGFLDPRPWESYRAMGRGVAAYFAGRLGPYEEQAE